jgi:hypothetical protein
MGKHRVVRSSVCGKGVAYVKIGNEWDEARDEMMMQRVGSRKTYRDGSAGVVVQKEWQARWSECRVETCKGRQ